MQFTSACFCKLHFFNIGADYLVVSLLRYFSIEG